MCYLSKFPVACREGEESLFQFLNSYVTHCVSVICFCTVSFDQRVLYPRLLYRPELSPPSRSFPFSRGEGVPADGSERLLNLPTCHPARPQTCLCFIVGVEAFAGCSVAAGGSKHIFGRQKDVGSSCRDHSEQE